MGVFPHFGCCFLRRATPQDKNTNGSTYHKYFYISDNYSHWHPPLGRLVIHSFQNGLGVQTSPVLSPTHGTPTIFSYQPQSFTRFLTFQSDVSTSSTSQSHHNILLHQTLLPNNLKPTVSIIFRHVSLDQQNIQSRWTGGAWNLRQKLHHLERESQTL